MPGSTPVANSDEFPARHVSCTGRALLLGANCGRINDASDVVTTLRPAARNGVTSAMPSRPAPK